jgi:hypothetical protein
MRTILKIEQKGLLLFAALSVFFLFFDGPGIIHARSFKHAWDLGHIAALAAWPLTSPWR